MDSASSSPGAASQVQSQKQAHSDLLRAFQRFKPRVSGASKTSQPSSSPQESSSAVKTNDQAAKTGTTTSSKQDFPTSRKRLCSSPAMDQTSENDHSDSDTPLQVARKRTRQTVSDKAKASHKKQANSPSKSVQVQIQVTKKVDSSQQPIQQPVNGRETNSGALQPVNSNTTNKQAVQVSTSTTPANAVSLSAGNPRSKQSVAMNGQPGERKTSIDSHRTFTSKLLDENQKLTETLSRKNQTFLNDMPVGARSYLEAKLSQVTAGIIQLHQEKVDAVRLEYVAELQRDMSERQKVIDMLLQKPQ